MCLISNQEYCNCDSCGVVVHCTCYGYCVITPSEMGTGFITVWFCCDLIELRNGVGTLSLFPCIGLIAQRRLMFRSRVIRHVQSHKFSCVLLNGLCILRHRIS
jgi:hypothetical protein